MANKYIIHGATYNGNGTSSAEATSSGGVGAWNAINILTGSTPAYGTLNTGDTVFIRSKTAAGADIAVESAAVMTLGASSKTVRWVLDNGVTWPGVDGVLTVRHTGSGGNDGYVSTRENNSFISLRKGAWIVTAPNYTGHHFFDLLGGVTIDGLEVSLGAVGSPIRIGTNGVVRLVNCHIKAHSVYSSYRMIGVTTIAGACVYIINCTIEVTNSFTGDVAVFGANTYGNQYFIIGGKVVGSILGAGGYRIWGGYGYYLLSGFKFPNNCLIDNSNITTSSRPFFTATGCDNLLGVEVSDGVMRLSSRKDGNFPTLNALLPDGITPWAWWMYAYSASMASPAILRSKKHYIQASSQLTLSLELLVSTTFAELNKENCYITVSYVDATTSDEKIAVSRVLGGGALDSSTASWTFTSYGAVSFDKKKITVQTPTSVKQNSVIEVCLVVETPANSTTKLLIVCPDVQAN